ncbi:N-acetyltransferase [Gordonia sp. HY002]|uniref:GNAT family N-acetyltransferase n=1 Tax=Gordonia zhenghanii TaxID=2911516 RepID=UPI001EF14BFF|nr:GNAT family N-acetyltransferase [Gordonia zhenghanii]MCF8569105.1 N-acetyltransferase [Gordonia zhenghanii]MCF8603424.1 N-acetyltransferase [Gordonia zhenghanii]
MQLRNRHHQAPQHSARSLLQQISQVVHNPDRERFELWVAGDLVGVLGYRIDDTDGSRVATILHTVMYDEYAGHGLATRLTGTAVAYMRDNDLRVRPVCTFTRKFLEAHPGVVPLAPV